MKITPTAASFALIAALSGISTAYAAGFNDRSVVPDAATSISAERQNLRLVPVVQGFNQQSHISSAALQPTDRASDAPVLAGAHCDPASRTGFQSSTSFVSC